MAKTLKAASGLDFLSDSALLAFIGYVILFIVVLLPLDWYVVDAGGKTRRVAYDVKERLFNILSILPIAALSVYTINCLMVGSCRTWSWINAIASFAFSLLVVAAILFFKP